MDPVYASRSTKCRAETRGELPLKAAVLRLTPALLGTYSPDVGVRPVKLLKMIV
jgi:hypothetical protein